MAFNHTGGRYYNIADYPVQRIALAVVYALIAINGIAGNFLVILAVLFSSKLRTITNAFVVNLSVADLFTCLSVPWSVVGLLNFGDLAQYPLPEYVCAGVGLTLFTCAGCSLYTLASIAINRWWLITRPVRAYRTLFTRKKVMVMILVTWLIPFLVALLPPLFGLGQLGYAEKYASCTHKTSHPLSDYYSMLQTVVLYPAPLVTIITCYILIFRHTKKHAKIIAEQADVSSTSMNAQNHNVANDSNAEFRKRLSRRQMEINRNLFYVVCAFFICITPYSIALAIPPSDPVIPWTAAILLLNSTINPYIYATKHPYFKVIFKLILCGRCSEIPEKSRFMRSMGSLKSFQSYRNTKRQKRAKRRNFDVKTRIAGISAEKSSGCVV